VIAAQHATQPFAPHHASVFVRRVLALLDRCVPHGSISSVTSCLEAFDLRLINGPRTSFIRLFATRPGSLLRSQSSVVGAQPFGRYERKPSSHARASRTWFAYPTKHVPKLVVTRLSRRAEQRAFLNVAGHRRRWARAVRRHQLQEHRNSHACNALGAVVRDRARPAPVPLELLWLVLVGRRRDAKAADPSKSTTPTARQSFACV
jgi:hypothetical protein